MKTVTLTWQPDRDRFEAAGGHAGQSVRINAPHGDGPPAGFSAAELLLAAAAGCSAWDVVEILRKQRQTLSGLEVAVHGTQASSPPNQFTDVELAYTAHGTGLDAAKVERAVLLSVERYCSVINTIRGVARIATRVEIVEATTPAA